MRVSLMRVGLGLSCSRAARTFSTNIIRTSSATAPSPGPAMSASGWWIGDHRREVRLGDQLVVDAGTTGELADGSPLLNEFDVEPEQNAGLHGRAEFRAFDGHEIHKLARAGEAQRFDGEDSRGLGQRLDDQNAGHDRATREMALEEGLVDGHRLDRGDPFLRIEALDP